MSEEKCIRIANFCMLLRDLPSVESEVYDAVADKLFTSLQEDGWSDKYEIFKITKDDHLADESIKVRIRNLIPVVCEEIFKKWGVVGFNALATALYTFALSLSKLGKDEFKYSSNTSRCRYTHVYLTIEMLQLDHPKVLNMLDPRSLLALMKLAATSGMQGHDLAVCLWYITGIYTDKGTTKLKSLAEEMIDELFDNSTDNELFTSFICYLSIGKLERLFKHPIWLQGSNGSKKRALEAAGHEIKKLIQSSSPQLDKSIKDKLLEMLHDLDVLIMWYSPLIDFQDFVSTLLAQIAYIPNEVAVELFNKIHSIYYVIYFACRLEN